MIIKKKKEILERLSVYGEVTDLTPYDGKLESHVFFKIICPSETVAGVKKIVLSSIDYKIVEEKELM